MRKGRVKSCGCFHDENSQRVGSSKLEDLSDKRFGKLTVLYRDVEKNNSNHTYWVCRCECGNIKSIAADHLKSEATISCGCEKLSHGAFKIKNVLEKNNCKYQLEYSFNDLIGKNGHKYRFDFAVLNENNTVNFLIEYDSKIHYEITRYSSSKEELIDIQTRDSTKNKYCIEHNIKLYRIPYFKIDDIDTLESLLNPDFLIK